MVFFVEENPYYKIQLFTAAGVRDNMTDEIGA
jgi:hypothetical protein